jgi:hypothetical protein
MDKLGLAVLEHTIYVRNRESAKPSLSMAPGVPDCAEPEAGKTKVGFGVAPLKRQAIPFGGIAALDPPTSECDAAVLPTASLSPPYVLASPMSREKAVFR